MKKALRNILIALLLIVLLALTITTLVFFFQGKNKQKTIDELQNQNATYKTEIANKDLQITQLEQTNTNLETALEEANKDDFANFVFDYTKYSTDQIRVSESCNERLGISIKREKDGSMSMCVYDKSYLYNYEGEISRKYKKIEGLDSKISSSYIFSTGQAVNPCVLFLLEDGTVQYLDKDKLLKGEFIVGGKLDASKVTRLMEVDVGFTEGSGFVAFATVDVNNNLKVFNKLP